MAKTLQMILGSQNLCGLIQGVKGGIPMVLPPSFMTSTRGITGNTCTYTRVDGSRETAVLVQYGSPSVARGKKGISTVPVSLLHSFENQTFDPTTLMNLQNFADEGKQNMGMQEVARQTAEFHRVFLNLRKAAVYSALFQGAIYFDSAGNLLPSSTNAVVTADMQIPAGNKNQCDILGAGSIIDADWDTAGTSISTHVQNLITAVLQNCGYQLEYAFYGASILDYLWGNTVLKEVINRNASTQAAFIAGDIPDGFLGIKKWVKCVDAFYVDQDGTVQTMIDDEDIVFTPAPSPEWWEVIEGSYPVPQSLRLDTDAISALGNLREARGMFSYAAGDLDPPSIKQYAGDTFIPIIKVPKAVVKATVSGF